MRRAIGDDAALLVDANSCYSPARAIEVGQLLADNGVSHFEEPCPHWKLDWTREVTAALELDVAGGEQDWDERVWQSMVDTRVVDVVQPDVCYVGGLTRALRVARLAAARGMPCTPHSANHSLVLVFALHLLAALENPGKYVEFSIEPDDDYPWQVGHVRAQADGRRRVRRRARRPRLGRGDLAGLARALRTSRDPARLRRRTRMSRRRRRVSRQ